MPICRCQNEMPPLRIRVRLARCGSGPLVTRDSFNRMDLGIEGRVALVGGASQGIGRAVAEALIAEGAQVVITARDQARTAAVADEIGAVAGYAWDSGDLDGAAPLVALIREQVGEIDILVTNTGGPPTGADPLAFSDVQWEQAHRTLVMAPIALVR